MAVFEERLLGFGTTARGAICGVDLDEQAGFAEFVAHLRAKEFRIGLEQQLNCLRLAERLEQQGLAPARLEDWAGWLAPLLCTNPEQQHEFAELWCRWVGKIPLTVTVNEQEVKAIKNTPEVSSAAKTAEANELFERKISRSQIMLIRWKRLFRSGYDHAARTAKSALTALLGLRRYRAVFLGSLFALFLLWLGSRLQVSKLFAEERSLAWRLYGPLLGLLCWWIWFRRRQHSRIAQLERLSALGLTAVEMLRVQTSAKVSPAGPGFRRLVKAMNRRPVLETPVLDEDATLQASLRRCQFTAVWQKRRDLRRYLLLIESQGHQDQRVRSLEDWLARLRRSGILARVYYFEKDPRRCRQGRSGPYRELSQIRGDASGEILLIFSECQVFFHPYKGNPHDWLEVFKAWPIRALVTLVPPEEWGFQHREMEKKGFAVVVGEQEALAAWLKCAEPRTVAPEERACLNQEPCFEWPLDPRPTRAEVGRQLARLRARLEPEAYQWLCACALYPELNGEITHWLGREMRDERGEPLLSERRLLQLERLPWFRQGWLPNWLRKALKRDLKRKAELVALFEQLFNPSAEQGIGGLELELAKQSGQAAGARVVLADPLWDPVFLSFYGIKTAGGLALSLPEGLWALLMRKGNPNLGLHPGWVVAGALLVGGLATNLLWAGATVLVGPLLGLGLVAVGWEAWGWLQGRRFLSAGRSGGRAERSNRDGLEYFVRVEEEEKGVEKQSKKDEAENEKNESISRNALPVGTLLDKYQIIQILGFEPFEITYLAEDKNLRCKRVIKEYMPDAVIRMSDGMVIPVSDSDEELFQWGMQLFIKDAKLLFYLSCPHVVEVTDLFIANQTAYIVMPYLEGLTLHEWIEQKAQPSQKELEDIFVPLLEGLKYIHEKKLLHSGITPKNIYLTQQGKPILINFGAVRIAIGKRKKVLTQVLSPHFSPIELYRMNDELTQALDLYSLAACMYYAITKELPKNALDRLVEDLQPKLVGSQYEKRYASHFLQVIDKSLNVHAKDRYQDGFHMQKALIRVEERLAGELRELEIPQGPRIRLRWCPPGVFLMGSPESEAGRFDDEVQHEVSLSRGYWMGETVVTQAQWRAVMGDNPSHFVGEDRPVERVSWEDARLFLEKLGRLCKEELRLPTEAEWEYACRAGTTTPFHFGKRLDATMANFNGNYPYGGAPKGEYRMQTTAVRSFAPNAWGLYDMHGNVWEWCADWYGEYPQESIENHIGPAQGADRVLRGGSWSYNGGGCRSADRSGSAPGSRDGSIGFRLATSSSGK